MVKAQKEPASESANALARQAIEKIKEIDRKATEQKSEQVDALNKAKQAILQRIAELQRQEQEIDAALRQITGRGEAPKAVKTRKPRADLTDLRDRLVRWLQSHKDQRYTSRQLQNEFPELQEVSSFALFIKPAIESGKINKEGILANMTYGAS